MWTNSALPHSEAWISDMTQTMDYDPIGVY